MADSTAIEPGFHAIHANHLEDLRRAVVYICRQNPHAAATERDLSGAE